MNTNNNKLNLKKSNHGKHKPDYYAKNKQKYLLANQKYRAKLKAQKKPKPRSSFLLQREQKLINCLDKHHITVPIPRCLKTKYPIIKGWNKPNWWWRETIIQLLAKGHNYFTLLNKDNSYKGVRIGCIDIDQKGWTKIPTKYWCCYITAGNGKIKLLFLYEDNEGLKTGKGYFQGEPILDFKVSGGIMGIGSYHPNGQPYQVKGAGSFFLKNNHIFKNPYEVMYLLKEDWGIEIKTMSKHFAYQKSQPTQTKIPFILQKLPIASLREPPSRGLNNLSKITNY
jgi:hypothetical protein